MNHPFIHDSYNIIYREPFGAISCGTKVTLRLLVPLDFSGNCSLRLWINDGEQIFEMSPSSIPTHLSGHLLEATINMPCTAGLVWYYFCINQNAQDTQLNQTDSRLYCGPANSRYGGLSNIFDYPPPSYQITVYQPTVTPEWWKNGAVFQIFPDRFCNGNEGGRINPTHPGSLLHTYWTDTPSYHRDTDGRIGHWDFFGGNLAGITKKLDYLKDLGISILYLNPIFEARSNHRYDTGNYKKIDPLLGTDEDFDILITEAKKRNISIILDGVFSHTGSDSIYFNKYGHYDNVGAANSPDSPYYPWYTFTDYPNEYQCWWDVDDLPNVNEMNIFYRKFICEDDDSVVRYWMRRGIKGFRLDVADELPDDFIELIRTAIKEEDPNGILIGEVWEDASNKMAYAVRRRYFYGQELDGVMNYPFRKVLLDFACRRITGEKAESSIMSIIENYPHENLLGSMNLLGSHDRPRILTLLGLGEDDDLSSLSENMTQIQKEAYRLSEEKYILGRRRLQMLSAFQMALPGVPSIYYGDESGMEGFSDPYNRGSYPWGSEDLIIREWYTDVLKMRKNYLSDLVKGSYSPLSIPNGCMGFKVESEAGLAFVCMNPNDSDSTEFTFSLPLQEQNSKTNSMKLFKCMELVSGSVILPSKECADGTIMYTVTLPCISTCIFYFYTVENHMNMPPGDGILLHPSSLPSPWRTGDFGANAYTFVDFLAKNNQKYWQILPLDMPDFGNSPYQALCCKSGNPVLISMELLVEQKLLSQSEIDSALHDLSTSTKDIPTELACFDEALESKISLLRLAYKRFSINSSEKFTTLASDFQRFLAKNIDWLPDFALFMTLREENQKKPWYDWDNQGLRNRDPAPLACAFKKYSNDVSFYSFVQFIFYSQWQSLQKYCHTKGIFIIGDLPMYVSGNSSDVWSNPELFSLDSHGKPDFTAGVPGDYFNPKGQDWGCPVFDWDKMESHNFSWWKKRLGHAISFYDYIRIDHFRGFDAHWSSKFHDGIMNLGNWHPTPGQAFFNELLKEFGSLPFIAEDLGHITPPVKILKNQFDFPGLEVYMFSDLLRYGNDLSSLFHTVAYTGTHDNDTLAGWYVKECLNDGLPVPTDTQCAEYCQSVINKLRDSPAPWVIIPLQDYFALPSTARMNFPGTVGGTNWRWMIPKGLWEKNCILFPSAVVD